MINHHGDRQYWIRYVRYTKGSNQDALTERKYERNKENKNKNEEVTCPARRCERQNKRVQGLGRGCPDSIFSTPNLNNRANESTGYTLVEPRHIRVPFLYRHYTHAADWPAPHFTLICRGSARVIPCCVILCPKLYPAAPDLYPDQTGNRRK